MKIMELNQFVSYCTCSFTFINCIINILCNLLIITFVPQIAYFWERYYIPLIILVVSILILGAIIFLANRKYPEVFKIITSIFLYYYSLLMLNIICHIGEEFLNNKNCFNYLRLSI